MRGASALLPPLQELLSRFALGLPPWTVCGDKLGTGQRAEPCPCLLPDEPVDQHNRQKTLEVMVSPAITCESGRGWGRCGFWALWGPMAGPPRCHPC